MVMRNRTEARAAFRLLGNELVPMPNPSRHIWYDEFGKRYGVILGAEKDGSSHQRSQYVQRMHRIGKQVPWPSLSVLTLSVDKS